MQVLLFIIFKCLWVWILKGSYVEFDWLIDWLIDGQDIRTSQVYNY